MRIVSELAVAKLFGNLCERPLHGPSLKFLVFRF